MHMPPVLELRDITKAFPGVLAIGAIDLARIRQSRTCQAGAAGRGYRTSGAAAAHRR
jgi:ABC-type sugar transport system ATPase subunit